MFLLLILCSQVLFAVDFCFYRHCTDLLFCWTLLSPRSKPYASSIPRFTSQREPNPCHMFWSVSIAYWACLIIIIVHHSAHVVYPRNANSWFLSVRRWYFGTCLELSALLRVAVKSNPTPFDIYRSHNVAHVAYYSIINHWTTDIFNYLPSMITRCHVLLHEFVLSFIFANVWNAFGNICSP